MRTILLALAFSAYSMTTVALPTSVEAELQAYIEIFQGNDTSTQQKTAEVLQWSGLSDPRLFDLIEAKLLAGYKNPADKNESNYLAWLAKALAYSGQEKYNATLSEVAANGDNRRIKSYAKESINTLKNYTLWNSKIINEANWQNAQSIDFNRFSSMIQSDVLELNRLAAKRVHYKHIYDEPLLDLLEAALLKNYLSDSGDDIFVDTWAWVSKAIAGSRNTKYKNTIELVAKSASKKKLRKHAKKYLDYYSS